MGKEPVGVGNVFSLIYDETLLSFALGCAITSILFLLIDYGYFVAQGQRKSFLDITYRGNNIFLIIVTWFSGAFVVGYFATFISIFEASKQSLVALGILWPVALSKIIAGAKGHLGAEELEEPVEEEEEEENEI